VHVPNQQSAKGTILYIDDDPMVLRALQKTLERMGYYVIEEMDAEAGIVAAQVFQPDLIILDVRMPRLSGPDVARILRQDAMTVHIPIIGLTADTSAETRALCLESGYTTHLTKPIPYRLLQQTIDFLMREQQTKK
jgi:two-component system, cell cycle response regulator DivK